MPTLSLASVFLLVLVACHARLVFDAGLVHRAQRELGQVLPVSVLRVERKQHRRFFVWDGDAILLDPSAKSRPFAFNVTNIYGPGWVDCFKGISGFVFYECVDYTNSTHTHICRDKVYEARSFLTEFPNTYIVEGRHAHLVRFAPAHNECFAEIVLAEAVGDRFFVIEDDDGIVVPIQQSKRTRSGMIPAVAPWSS
ncbi:hypothetical protein AAVH_06657 [Aphelenchoides avenae]|nr:hypothetical protein AAVH_06657 [Aphelenchus avenae]